MPGPAVVENKLSDTQREVEAYLNTNRTIGITGLHTIVDQVPEVAKDK